jgi:3-dehydroquinate synthase
VTTTTIAVEGTRSYNVVVGRNLLDTIGPFLGSAVRRVLIVHQPSNARRAAAMRESLSADYEVVLAEVPDAEAAKRVEVAAFCWQVLGRSDFTRSDAIIGLGGGAVTDLAGFVAATWLRGVTLVHVPSTALGMVDAAIGGKTGINTAEGKNLVGSFYQPSAVIVDLDTLATLPRNDLLSGFGEIVKYGFIAEPEILDIIEGSVDKATDPSSEEFRRLVELSIGIKARVVRDDFAETGLREILNYGHTMGHAIEHAERYRWRHGAAVSVGMVFAAELSRLVGALSDEVVDRHRRVLQMLDLPTTYPLGRWEALLSTMRRDKKTRGSHLRFIVLDDLAIPRVITSPEPSLLYAAYQETAS